MPPEGAPRHELNFPIFLRAFDPDDPDQVAWTLIRAPGDDASPGGNIRASRARSRSPHSAGFLCLGQRDRAEDEPATSLGGRVTGNVANDRGATVSLSDIILRLPEGISSASMIRIGGSGEGGTAVARTDEEGRYRLTHLPRFWSPCFIDLRASAPGYVSRDRRLTIGEAWSSDEINLELFPARVTIVGRLIDDRGTPLPDRPVLVLVNGERMPNCSATTDATGAFELRNCPPVPGLQIQAELSRSPDSQQTVSEPWYYLDVVHDVRLVPNQTRYELTLTAQRPDVTIKVQVRDTAGNPLPCFPCSWTARACPTTALRPYGRPGCCTLENVPRAGISTWTPCRRYAFNEQLSDQARKLPTVTRAASPCSMSR